MTSILLGIVVTAIGSAIGAGIIFVAKRIATILEDDDDDGDGPEGGMVVINW